MSVGRLGERKRKDVNRISKSPVDKATIATKVTDAAIALATLRIADICRDTPAEDLAEVVCWVPPTAGGAGAGDGGGTGDVVPEVRGSLKRRNPVGWRR